MSPAQRRYTQRSRGARVSRMTNYQRSHRRSKKIIFSKKLAFIITFLLIPIFFLVVVTLSSANWNSNQKFTLAIEDKSGDINVLIVDKSQEAMSILNIPGSTEVEVSRGLGKWRLKSVQRLAEKEGQHGLLLTETLTKYMHFPVFSWANSEALGFLDGSLLDQIKATFGTYKTNLGLGDRVKLLYYILNIKNYKKEKINLADTKYLKKTLLSDGEEGYVLTGSMPTGLAVLFSLPEFSKNSGRVQIVDKTDARIGSKLGSLIEVLGLKVVSVDKEVPDDSDCKVVGASQNGVSLIARLLNCSEETNSDLGFDLRISIGNKFERRY